MGTHSYNLLQLERPHLGAVSVGARPFWVEHCGRWRGWSERSDGNEAKLEGDRMRVDGVQAAAVYRRERERLVGRSVGRLAESGDGQFECYAGQMWRMDRNCRRPWFMSGARARRGVQNGRSFCEVAVIVFFMTPGRSFRVQSWPRCFG